MSKNELQDLISLLLEVGLVLELVLGVFNQLEKRIGNTPCMRLLYHSSFDQDPGDLLLDLEGVWLFSVIIRKKFQNEVDEEECDRVGVANVVHDRVQYYFSEL